MGSVMWRLTYGFRLTKVWGEGDDERRPMHISHGKCLTLLSLWFFSNCRLEFTLVSYNFYFPYFRRFITRPRFIAKNT